MTNTYTTRLRKRKPAAGDFGWDDEWHDNANIDDVVISSLLSTNRIISGGAVTDAGGLAVNISAITAILSNQLVTISAITGQAVNAASSGELPNWIYLSSAGAVTVSVTPPSGSFIPLSLVDTDTSDILRLADLRPVAARDVYPSSTTVSVKMFGAVGNGTTDDTAAFQAAVDYVSTAGKGIVLVPAGVYLLTDTITVSHNNVSIRGESLNTVTIYHTGDYGDTFYFTGNEVAGTLTQNVEISGIYIITTTATTNGAAVHMSGISIGIIKDIRISEGFGGLLLESYTASRIENIRMDSYGVGADTYNGRYGMYFGANDAYAHPSCGGVFIDTFNLRSSLSANMFDSVLYIDSSDGLWFNNGHFGNGTTANITIDNAYPVNDVNNLVFFDNVMCDEGIGHGVRFKGSTSIGRNILFTNCSFKGGSSGGYYGIYAESGALFYNVGFSNCTIVEYSRHGVLIDSSTFNKISFTGCTVCGNGVYSAGVFSGYRFQSASNISVTGGYSGHNNVTMASTTQAYGASFTGTNTNICFYGVDLRGNSAGATNDILSGTSFKGCHTDAKTIASAATITPPAAADEFFISGSTTITNITADDSLRKITLVFNGTLTVQNSGNIGMASAFSATPGSVLSLIYDGSYWRKI